MLDPGFIYPSKMLGKVDPGSIHPSKMWTPVPFILAKCWENGTRSIHPREMCQQNTGKNGPQFHMPPVPHIPAKCWEKWTPVPFIPAIYWNWVPPFQVARTVKFLSGISVCHYVITPEWIEQCEREGQLVNEEGFTLRDADAEETFSMDIPTTLSRARTTKLLQVSY